MKRWKIRLGNGGPFHMEPLLCNWHSDPISIKYWAWHSWSWIIDIFQTVKKPPSQLFIDAKLPVVTKKHTAWDGCLSSSLKYQRIVKGFFHESGRTWLKNFQIVLYHISNDNGFSTVFKVCQFWESMNDWHANSSGVYNFSRTQQKTFWPVLVLSWRPTFLWKEHCHLMEGWRLALSECRSCWCYHCQKIPNKNTQNLITKRRGLLWDLQE